MYLWQGVLRVRQALNELQPWLFSDDEIVAVLNESARRMCSAAQFLNGFSTFTTTPNFQEYVLPADVDQITMVSYLSGVLFPIAIVPRESIQIGGKVGGIPFWGYVSKQTRVLTPQNNNAGLDQIPLNPNDGGDSRTVLGLYPIPNGELPVYIHYLMWHPQMVNPEDICQIPDRFMQGWASYAIARMKEKQSAFDEAAYFDAQHDRYMQEFVDYMTTNGQEITAPQYQNRSLSPYFLKGASTVLVVAQNPSVTNL